MEKTNQLIPYTLRKYNEKLKQKELLLKQKRKQYIEKSKGKKFIDNLKKMIAKKEIIFYHPSIQQSLQNYITDNTDEEELKDYMNKLVKYKLVRMNYEPNKITLECNHFENRYNQLKILYKNNPNIKELTINGCKINIANIQLISQFTNLRELSLQSVDLNVGLGLYIKKLNKLEYLCIKNNPRLKLIDYEDITSMETITDLDISMNTNINSSHYKDEIFKLIGNMKQLEILNMELTVPGRDAVNESYYATAIKNLTKLDVIIYSNCKLTGSCFSDLKARSLAELYLDYNEINDEGIKNISKINSLELLNLTGNGLGINSINIIPLFNMKKLENLNLSINSLRRLNISDLRKSSLLNLYLNNNIIDNEGIKDITKITSLRVLNLSSNNLGPRNINLQPLFNMTQLKELDLSNNELKNVNIIDIDKLKDTKINLD